MAAEPGLLSGRLALGWLIGGEWRFHPARFLTTAIAIAVGVALGFAVHLVNGSALASFDGAVRGVNGAAELSVTATSPLGIDERLYPQVLQGAGVADASPVVRLDARIGGNRLTLLGLDVIRAAAVTPSLVGIPPQGPASSSDGVFDESSLFLSRTALERSRLAIGDRVTVTANGRNVPLRVVGTLPAAEADAAIGVIDIAAAQWRFERIGRIDRIDLSLSNRRTAEEALAQLLPADAILSTAQARGAQGSALSRAYRVNLDMLALVALLTGGFLVYSAQSLSVARRQRAFALLRTLGMPRRAVVAAVVVEGVVIGIVGGATGLAAGYGLAWSALHWFGGDLGAGYFGGTAARIVFQPAAAAGFFALGLIAAVLGSAVPARAAARAAPAAALKNAGDVLDPRRAVAWWPAAVLLAAGGGAALLPATGGLPLFGFLGMALMLAGGVAGVPWFARSLLAPLARRRGGSVPAMLAIRHLHGAPGEAATALCGIVASTALMIAMATMVTSFRGAVDTWLGQVLGADLYLRANAGASFDPATRAHLAATPGVDRLAFSRQLPLTIAADRPPISLIARPERGGRDPLLVLVERTSSLPASALPVWVSEPAQRLYGWDPGETIILPIAGRTRFTVAGVWRDYGRQAGAVLVDEADYQRLTGDTGRDEVSATLQPGSDATAVGKAMTARLPGALRGQVDVTQPAVLRRLALTLFDRSFAVTYLLEAVAILVGLAGVAATMSAQTIAREREFGMLRHLGLTRGQLGAMLATEGAVVGLTGALAGIGLGLVLAQVLIHVINPQSFNWTMTTRVPLGTLFGVAAALTGASAATAVLAGRRATATGAVQSVREDW
ncbi:ABC transporter permease [Microvirga sp. SRT01]|uniref:ABC transporter permease n=1 Tax=Sphingomonas longa TaxID=2778730 RepID=A0ABS2D314_9SPHN|nr:ABC transporter permease [Microvirga sp. SRT01]MBM6575317.1 ABC transporter permease [Sphingomonas sp. BT552]MBR7708367.1 ABC transporter permease [Microvirga sp. SRT01]